jgi:hypothetical protein
MDNSTTATIERARTARMLVPQTATYSCPAAKSGSPVSSAGVRPQPAALGADQAMSALCARDVLARAAERHLPWIEAHELANTLAQHLSLGLEGRRATTRVVRHRVQEGWINVTRSEERALCRELMVALETEIGTVRRLRPDNDD